MGTKEPEAGRKTIVGKSENPESKKQAERNEIYQPTYDRLLVIFKKTTLCQDLEKQTKCLQCLQSWWCYGCEACGGTGKATATCRDNISKIDGIIAKTCRLFGYRAAADTILENPEIFKLSGPTLTNVKEERQWIAAIRNAKKQYDDNVEIEHFKCPSGNHVHGYCVNRKTNLKCNGVRDPKSTNCDKCQGKWIGGWKELPSDEEYLCVMDHWIIKKERGMPDKVPVLVLSCLNRNCHWKMCSECSNKSPDKLGYFPVRRRAMTSIPAIEPFNGQNFTCSVVALTGMALGIWLGKGLLKRFLRKRAEPTKRTQNDREI